jgi:hypothetical protein
MSLSRFARLSAAVVSMGVLSSVSQAQPLTADTITGSAPTSSSILFANSAYTQTFTGVSEVSFVTFRFLAPNNPISTGAVFYSLTTWAGNQATGEILSDFFMMAPGFIWAPNGAGSVYIDGVLDLSAAGPLNPASTYGISIFGNASLQSESISLATNANTSFTDGVGFYNFSASNVAGLSVGNSSLGQDLAFSAIGSAAPVPEASSAAVLFTGMFVGGLMLRRRRRQPADAGLLASATQA